MLKQPYSAVLDLETLDTEPDSVITEIGVIIFNRTTFEEVACLSHLLDIPDQIILGRTISKETLLFHRREKSLPDVWTGTPFKTAMIHTWAWIKEQDPARIWMQGKDFDHPILKSAMRHAGIPMPSPYFEIKDSRDTCDNAFPGVRHGKRPHRALPDCRATLVDLAKSFAQLNLSAEAA